MIEMVKSLKKGKGIADNPYPQEWLTHEKNDNKSHPYPKTYPEIFFRESISKNDRISNIFEKYFFITVSNFILIY